MTRRQILQGIEQVAREHLGRSVGLKETTHLYADLELDSLEQLTFVVELENHFRISFDEGDEAGLVRVGDVIALIERRLHLQSDS